MKKPLGATRRLKTSAPETTPREPPLELDAHGLNLKVAVGRHEHEQGLCWGDNAADGVDRQLLNGASNRCDELEVSFNNGKLH